MHLGQKLDGGIVFERRRDGTLWRHEMSREQCETLTRMMHAARMIYGRGHGYAFCVALAERAMPGFADGIVSTLVPREPATPIYEPSVIFIDELVLPRSPQSPS